MSLPRVAMLLTVCVLSGSVVTGCGSSSSSTKQQYTTTTTRKVVKKGKKLVVQKQTKRVAVGAGSVADAKRWNGRWESTFGTMQLTAGVGGKLSGTYAYCGGTIIASASGSRLTGTWTESDDGSPKCTGAPAGHKSGSFVWDLAGDTFDGTWTFSDGTKSAQGDSWHGDRLS